MEISKADIDKIKDLISSGKDENIKLAFTLSKKLSLDVIDDLYGCGWYFREMGYYGDGMDLIKYISSRKFDDEIKYSTSIISFSEYSFISYFGKTCIGVAEMQGNRMAVYVGYKGNYLFINGTNNFIFNQQLENNDGDITKVLVDIFDKSKEAFLFDNGYLLANIKPMTNEDKPLILG